VMEMAVLGAGEAVCASSSCGRIVHQLVEKSQALSFTTRLAEQPLPGRAPAGEQCRVLQ